MAIKKSKFFHVNLLEELRLEPEDWFSYLRMNEETYNELLKIVTPHIEKLDTRMRKAITPHERLTSTLRFLATGRSYEDLKYICAISSQSLGQIIPETCKALYDGLKNEYLKFPKTEDEWNKIGKDFDTKWQFTNCLGSVDGKHIRITPPPGSGSYYWNYKGYNNGGVLEQTSFYQKLTNKQLNLPNPQKVRNGATELSNVFIGDEAFHQRPDFLKPFPQDNLSKEKKIFKYRLSRARRIIENVFGIRAARFRILHTSINMRLDRIDLVVLTCAVLHIFLRRKCSDSYTPEASLDTEDWENSTLNAGLRMNPDIISGLQRGSHRHYATEAYESRNNFLRYFNNEGKVNWQDNMIH